MYSLQYNSYEKQSEMMSGNMNKNQTKYLKQGT